jgi:hypothetical protein
MDKKLIVVSILFILALNYSCTYDNEEDLLKQSSCDTTQIVYNDLTHIFTNICAVCHNSTSTYREGIVMDSYEHVITSIETGLVWKAINHQEGVTPMPYQSEKLDDCTIKRIKAWIDRGMPE